MKIGNDHMVKLLTSSKIKRFEGKIKNGDITFSDCGLEVKKNFLNSSGTLLLETQDDIERYCMNMCASSPHSKCAVFLIYYNHHVACEVKFDFTDYDFFSLDDNWHCWNFISLEEEFDLPVYGILCETRPGEWKIITD